MRPVYSAHPIRRPFLHKHLDKEATSRQWSFFLAHRWPLWTGFTVHSLSPHTRVLVQGTRYAGRTQNYSIERLAALEARAMKRAKLGTLFYLPIIFFGYGFILGMYMGTEKSKTDKIENGLCA